MWCLDPSALETLMRALEVLNYLGALDDEGDLTDLGRQMAELPLDPQLSKMLICSPDYNCSEEIVSIVAAMSVPQIFLRPRELPMEERKQWCWDNFINDRSIQSAESVKKQLKGIMTRLDIPLMTCRGKSGYDTVSSACCICVRLTLFAQFLLPLQNTIRKALTTAMYMQVAHLQCTGTYLTVKDNQIVYLHPSSVIDGKPQWVIFEEFALTSKNYIRTVTTTRGEWLVELAPHCFDLENFSECDAKDDLILEYKKLARRMGK